MEYFYYSVSVRGTKYELIKFTGMKMHLKQKMEANFKK